MLPEQLVQRFRDQVVHGAVEFDRHNLEPVADMLRQMGGDRELPGAGRGGGSGHDRLYKS